MEVEKNPPQRRAYDTLKGVIYSLQTSDYVRSILERELDLLYESWYRLQTKSVSSRGE